MHDAFFAFIFSARLLKLIRELRTVIEQYKGSSRLSLDSITSSLETCSRWLKAKSKEVSDEHAEVSTSSGKRACFLLRLIFHCITVLFAVRLQSVFYLKKHNESE